MTQLLLIALIFFLIALIYSSVGFGGGSSYIAILVLFNFAFPDLRIIALACNVIVVFGSVIKYYNYALLDLKKSLLLVLVSVPFAFLGALIKIDRNSFLIILAVLLLVAAALMVLQVFRKSNLKHENAIFSTWQNTGLGGGIGFLAGITGIGGGIYLSPALNLLNWDKAKKIAATCSLFILLNSIAGLMGHWEYFGRFEMKAMLVPAGAVLLGGQIGSRLGIKIFSANTVRILTACLVGFVGIRILVKLMA